jgi:cytochrome bd-type quinol oxidase subunit 2
MREGMLAALVILALLLVVMNVVATVVVLRSEASSATQRIFQSCVVWLVPLLGAVVVILFHRLDRRRQDPQGARADLDGSEIDVALALRHDGHH